VEIEANLREVSGRIARTCERSHRTPEEIILVAVSKGFDAQAIREAFDCGLRHFGENRVQEADVKIEQLCDLRTSITWHMVGHLQSNKAKIAVQRFDIIHSVDSARLACILNGRAQKLLPVLLQVNVAGEEPRSGFVVEEIAAAAEEMMKLPNLQVKGLMTIAPLVDNPEEVRPVFRKLRQLRDSLGLEHLSMGMTDDFEVAIEEGATIIRIGRAIFGQRRYS